ncbi:MAG: ABC transporter permease subunit, partial [Clostridiales bacterium]|nr:ABC transporter permease subunit [Clostridiales bacterium]
MNIFLQEVKSNLRSLVYWTVGICVLLIVFMSIFTTISKDMAAMNKILESFPPEFAKALGLSEIDLSQLIGYYGFLFVYVLLTGGIFAMKLGISSLSEEIRTKTSDFLLVKPVRRHVIVSAKLLSVLVLLIAQNLAFFAVSTFTVSALRN